MDVEIRHIDNIKGKGLFAKKNFETGAVIFKETPLVCAQFSWNAAYGYKACDNCLKPLETAEENVRRLSGRHDIVLPHPECCTTKKDEIVCCELCGTEFCSNDCRTRAYNQYHKTMCLQSARHDETHPFNKLNEIWKHIHFPPETSTIMLIPRILATIQQSANKEEALSQFLQFCHRSTNEDSEIAHKLLGEKFVNQITELHEALVKAVSAEGVSQLLTLNGFQSLLALIGTNGQGVGTSAISQWVEGVTNLPLPDDEKKTLDELIDILYEQMDAQSGTFLNNEGVALYSLQSACNHNCVPNAESTFLDNSSTLSLVALKDIAEGEEICISYLDECALQSSRHTRQKQLKENYLFVCNCEKCLSQADDPDVTSEEEMSE